METLILSFVVLILIVVGMAVGVLMGRKPIAGSCGGMTALGMDVAAVGSTLVPNTPIVMMLCTAVF